MGFAAGVLKRFRRPLSRLEKDGVKAFRLKAARIQTLKCPSAFHSRLISLCRRARHRISFSALYLGTGKLEHQLVDAVREAASRGVQVTFLLDAARAQRRDQNNGQSSLSILSKLKTEFPSAVTIATIGHAKQFLDLLPNGRLKDIFGLVSEVLGVYHLKIFAIDHVSILSGANLSQTYFTDRLDRYLVVPDIALARWHHRLTDILASSDAKKYPPKSMVPSNSLIHAFSPRPLRAVHIITALQSRRRTASKQNIVWCFPAVQALWHKQSLRLEEKLFFALLDTAHFMKARTCLGLATAYLNPPPDIIHAIEKSTVPIDIITPAISAHGFAGASGVRALVPTIYRLIAHDFYYTLKNALLPHKRLLEWQQATAGGTFHAKGAWLLHRGSALATITGSSNFNMRARDRDMELSYVLCSTDSRVRRTWTLEWRRYYRNSIPTSSSFAKEDVSGRPFTTPWLFSMLRPFVRSLL